MKLLIVSQYFKPELLPINYVVSLLAKEGFDIEVLTAKPNYPSGVFFEGHGFFSKITEEVEDITVYRLPILPRGRNHSAIGLSLNYLSFIVSASILAPFLLRKKNYDMVFVYGTSPIIKTIPALFIGKIKKIPVILWVQDLWPDSINSTSYKIPKIFVNLIKYFVRYIYKNVDLILVTSSGFIEKIISDFDINNRKVFHLPNIIDEIFLSKRLKKESIKNDLENYSGKFNILFTGNIGSAQSIETVIESASILKKNGIDEINYLIVGSGSKIDDHKALISMRQLDNVNFLGQYPIECMPIFIEFADILLITLRDEEAFSLTVPNKMQSYLASKKPIIGALNGAGAELIKSINCGLVSEAENAEKLAQNSIDMMKMSKSELQKMALNGFSYFEKNYSDDIFVLKLKEYIELVIKK